MKTLITPLLGLCLFAGLSAKAGDSDSKPETLKAFTTADRTISKDVIVTDDKVWLIEGKRPKQSGSLKCLILPWKIALSFTAPN